MTWIDLFDFTLEEGDISNQVCLRVILIMSCMMSRSHWCMVGGSSGFEAILVIKLFIAGCRCRCMVGLLGSMLVCVCMIYRLFRSTDWCIWLSTRTVMMIRVGGVWVMEEVVAVVWREEAIIRWKAKAMAIIREWVTIAWMRVRWWTAWRAWVNDYKIIRCTWRVDSVICNMCIKIVTDSLYFPLKISSDSFKWSTKVRVR